VVRRTASTSEESRTVARSDGDGLPPAGTGILANRAWIRDGENRLLFQPDSPYAVAGALRRAVKGPGLREKARALKPEIVRNGANFRTRIRRLTEIFAMLVEGDRKGVKR
jgi:glycosyltransferase involved in cell wall biosynthesis